MRAARSGRLALKQRIHVTREDQGARADLHSGQLTFVDELVDGRATEPEHRGDFVDVVANPIHFLLLIPWMVAWQNAEHSSFRWRVLYGTRS